MYYPPGTYQETTQVTTTTTTTTAAPTVMTSPPPAPPGTIGYSQTTYTTTTPTYTTGVYASGGVGMMPPPPTGPMATTTTTYTTTTAAPPPPGTYVTIPTSYTRVTYTYTTPYSRMAPFVPPVGLDFAMQQKMLRASEIFRMFDKNCNGLLSFKEWEKAMKHLGYHMSPYDAERLFMMIDTNRSGYIDEREFCEFWLVYGW
jgi:hypothetical protein